jgi:hypothetical protein
MKRGTWVIGIGVLAGVGLSVVEQAYAGENNQGAKCTLETLKGKYLGAANGMLTPPVPPIFNTCRDSTVGNGRRLLFGLLRRRHGDGLGDIHR